MSSGTPVREFDPIPSLKSGLRYHFIAGLPRSGSTMLAALLNQNPRFYASGTSPAQPMFSMLYANMSGDNELSALLDDGQRAHLLRGLIENTHAPHRGDAKVVFDTNRKWLLRVDQLSALFPLCRFIVCVRDPVRVVNSLEKARRSVTFRQSRMFNPNLTLEQRVERMLSKDGILGTPMAVVRDALQGPHAERMIVLDYDRLIAAPQETLSLLYKCIREPVYQHDFDNFDFSMPKFDAYLNAPGLHSIKGPLRSQQDDTLILPPHVVEKLADRAVWRTMGRTSATMLLSA